MDWQALVDSVQGWLVTPAVHSLMLASPADVVDGGTESWLDDHTASS